RWQDDPKDRTATDGALELDRAVQRSHDPETDRETETGADAGRLGREERIEDPRAMFGGNSGSVVRNLDDDVSIAHAGSETDDVSLEAAFVERLRGVDDQIEKHLTESRFVSPNRGNVPERLLDVAPVLELVLRHHQDALEHSIDVDVGERLFVGAREGLEVLH